MNVTVGSNFGGFLQFLTVAFLVASFAVHVAFALAVWNNAQALREKGAGTALIEPVWWTLATLLGGVFVAGLYWVVHHSTLRPNILLKEEASQARGEYE